MASQHLFDRACRAGVAGLIAAGLLGAAVQAAPQGSGSFEFTVDGQKVASDVWTFARSSKTDFNLTSNIHRDKRVLLLNLRNPQPGKPLALGSMASGSKVTITNGVVRNGKIGADQLNPPAYRGPRMLPHGGLGELRHVRRRGPDRGMTAMLASGRRAERSQQR